MNIRQLLGVVAFLTFFSGGAMTQNLSVSYKNKPLEEVLADLKQKTNYNFVYQKQILAGTRSVTANFNDMPLTYILDRVLYNNGLDYEIVKENVIIRPADKENFKKVVSGRVVDIQNIPMPGVNVRVKDTGTGVATGINGEFSIPVEGSHPVLVFFVYRYARQRTADYPRDTEPRCGRDAGKRHHDGGGDCYRLSEP